MTERTNRRSKSLLTGEAVSADLDPEFDFIEGIKRGLTDAAAGRVVPHEEAMAEIDAVIDTVQAKRPED
jgi:predicted transcriptional regulator